MLVYDGEGGRAVARIDLDTWSGPLLRLAALRVRIDRCRHLQADRRRLLRQAEVAVGWNLVAHWCIDHTELATGGSRIRLIDIDFAGVSPAALDLRQGQGARFTQRPPPVHRRPGYIFQCVPTLDIARAQFLSNRLPHRLGNIFIRLLLASSHVRLDAFEPIAPLEPFTEAKRSFHTLADVLLHVMGRFQPL